MSEGGFLMSRCIYIIIIILTLYSLAQVFEHLTPKIQMLIQLLNNSLTRREQKNDVFVARSDSAWM